MDQGNNSAVVVLQNDLIVDLPIGGGGRSVVGVVAGQGVAKFGTAVANKHVIGFRKLVIETHRIRIFTVLVRGCTGVVIARQRIHTWDSRRRCDGPESLGRRGLQ